MEKRAGLAVALVLAFSSGASFADCTDQEDGSNCPEGSEAAQASTAVKSEESKGYTWDELVEAIPQLKQYELGFQKSKEKGASKDEGTYMVCQKVKAPDSRIKRRTCMPLKEYLAYATEQRSAAERARLELLDRQSIDPVTTFVRRFN